MKKQFLHTLCLLLIVLLFVPVFAEDTTLENSDGKQTGQTMVILNMAETYAVVIPASLPIAYNAPSTEMTVAVTDLFLAPSHAVRVSVDSVQGQMTQTDGAGILPFTLAAGEQPFEAFTFARDGARQLSVDIAQQDWYAAPAGSYTGSITFNIEIANAQ